MYSNGVRDYDREGKEIQTGLVAGKAIRAAEVRTSGSGKQYCTVGIRAFTRKDGTPAFLNIKAWDSDLIDQLQGVCKGDRILAAGRLSIWESQNGRQNTDLIPDFLLVSGQGGTPAPAGGAEPPAYQELNEEEEPGELPF